MTFLLIFQRKGRERTGRDKGQILAIGLGMSHLTSLSLSFLPCEMNGLATSSFQSCFLVVVVVVVFAFLSAMTLFLVYNLI